MFLAVLNLNHPAHFLNWGPLSISIPNLVIILVMVFLFILALMIPFPNHSQENKKGEK